MSAAKKFIATTKCIHKKCTRFLGSNVRSAMNRNHTQKEKAGRKTCLFCVVCIISRTGTRYRKAVARSAAAGDR